MQARGLTSRSDQNGWSAGAALGSFQRWGQGRARAQLLSGMGCPTPHLTKLQLGTGEPWAESPFDLPLQLASWDPQSPQTYSRLTCHEFEVLSVASSSLIPIMSFWQVLIIATAVASILEAYS